MTEEKKPLSIKDEIAKIDLGTQTGEPKEETKTKEVLPKWLQLLLADSPDKTIAEYGAHPLNFDGSVSMGRIIRGTEGMLGSLNKAVIDIVVGVVQKISEIMKSREPE